MKEQKSKCCGANRKWYSGVPNKGSFWICSKCQKPFIPESSEEKEEECVFCNIANRTGEDIIDIEPLNPVVKGHRIVFARQHSDDFTDNIGLTMRVIQRASEIAKELGGDFNLITSKGGYATQSVFHLHIHIIPRKQNDGLKLPWTNQLKSSTPPTNSNWEEEFDKKIHSTVMSNGLKVLAVRTDDVKDFIRSLIQSEREKEREKIKSKAKEYLDKGFELETFIYSGFLGKLDEY